MSRRFGTLLGRVTPIVAQLARLAEARSSNALRGTVVPMSVASALVAGRVKPRQLVEAACQRSELSFLVHVGTSPLLAIRLAGDAADAVANLEAAEGDEDAQETRPAAPLGFQTGVARAVDLDALRSSRSRPSPEDDDALLSRMLAEWPHYVTPLRKRADLDAAFAGRISVGRATNTDIVLRHTSVSKFHAWFERDEDGELSIADAGSTNGTRVNDVRLAARERHRVAHGDHLLLGSIHALVCDPRSLWRVLRKSIA